MAAAVLFLASDESSYMTGWVIPSVRPPPRQPKISLTR
ncbi:hypothetical protein ACFXD5_36170 [Streptomyces sp. NPDC059385]